MAQILGLALATLILVILLTTQSDFGDLVTSTVNQQMSLLITGWAG